MPVRPGNGRATARAGRSLRPEILDLEERALLSTLTARAEPPAVAPATASIRALATPSPRSIAYLNALYGLVIFRAPTADELSYWGGRLDGGMTTADMANVVVTSAERRTLEVRAGFARFLSREPDASARAYWLDRMNQGATTIDLGKGLMGSADFQRMYPSTSAFVTGVYNRVMERNPTPSERNSWVSRLNRGYPRAQMTGTFLQSDEFLKPLFQSYYATFLGRAGSASELTYWANQVRQGQTIESALTTFVSSPEFLGRVYGG